MATDFKKNMHKRMIALFCVVALLFGIDAFRVLYISVIKGDEYSAKAESQQLSDTEIEAMRGTIYDCDGNVLAQSATVWDIFIDPANITNNELRKTVVDGLSQILKFDDKEKEELAEKTKRDSRYVVVAEKVENDIKEQVADFVSDNAGMVAIIGSTQTTRRYYPYGNFASSVIGFTGSDNQGLSGIEAYYDEELTGKNGRITTVKDAQSNKLPMDYETSIDAIDGNSLKLTINQNIQYYLEKNLKETLDEYQAKGTYGVVMDCNTGAILAMSSMPDFDCNEPYKITYSKTKKDIKKIKDKKEKETAQSLAIQNQWRNFTISDTYEPGSVFKTFVASAALEENVATLDTTYNCTGGIQVSDYFMKCHYHPGHGVQTFTQGLENSCNPFFITIGQRLGVHNYFKYFDAYGFTKKTGIDLPGEAAPQFYPEEKYGIVELSSASFGQTNSLTPIQVCTGLCAIANGGTLLKPYVVDEIDDADGNVVSKTEPQAVRQVISEETSKKLCMMMKSVVDNGTGKNGYVAGYNVGGKTGTSTKLAESGNGKTKYIVSFGAIAPADDPRVAMLIVCDEPKEDLGGGAICAPIAAQVIEQAMSEMNIEPKYDEKEQKTQAVRAPKLIGKDIDSAKSVINSSNLTYKVIGNGKSVVSQSPVANTSVPAGGVIVLYTKKDAKKESVKVPDFTGMSVSEANREASDYGLNIEISGNNLSSSSIVAYKQSIEKGTKVSVGSVIKVSFKSTTSVLD